MSIGLVLEGGAKRGIYIELNGKRINFDIGYRTCETIFKENETLLMF